MFVRTQDSKRKTPSVAATPVVAAQTPATAASDDYGDSFDDFEEPPSTAKKSPMPVVDEAGDDAADARQLDFEPESAPELAPALTLTQVPMSAQDMMLDAADGVIDGADLADLLSQWSLSSVAADLDGDGTVAGGDLAILLARWGNCL